MCAARRRLLEQSVRTLADHVALGSLTARPFCTSFSSSSFLTSSPSLKADSLRRDVILIYHAQPMTVFMWNAGGREAGIGHSRSRKNRHRQRFIHCNHAVAV